MNIFFDLDDTLYERSDPFARAYETYFEGREMEKIPMAFRRVTDRCNEVFLQSQRGEITIEAMHIYRLTKGLADVGITISDEQALELQKLYLKNQQEIRLADGAAELLAYCASHFDTVGILTNGPAQHQKDKIRALGLTRFMKPKNIIISGVVGIDKPDLRIFQMVEDSCGVHAAAPADFIYVGDSYKSDILPSKEKGWRAIWLHKEFVAPPETPVHDLEVKNLREVLPYLEPFAKN